MSTATFLIGYFALSIATALGVGRYLRWRGRPPAMGWRCAECGRAFPHGRMLVRHLLDEHPEAAPVSRETRPGP